MHDPEWYLDWFPSIESPTQVRRMIESVRGAVSHSVYERLIENAIDQQFVEEFVFEDDADLANVELLFSAFNANKEANWVDWPILHPLNFDILRLGWGDFLPVTNAVTSASQQQIVELYKSAFQMTSWLRDSELHAALVTQAILCLDPQASEWRDDLYESASLEYEALSFGLSRNAESARYLLDLRIAASGRFSPKRLELLTRELSGAEMAPSDHHDHGSLAYPDSGWRDHPTLTKQEVFTLSEEQLEAAIPQHDFCLVHFGGAVWQCRGAARSSGY